MGSGRPETGFGGEGARAGSLLSASRIKTRELLVRSVAFSQTSLAVTGSLDPMHADSPSGTAS